MKKFGVLIGIVAEFFCLYWLLCLYELWWRLYELTIFSQDEQAVELYSCRRS